MYILIDSKLQICDKSFKKTPQGYLMLDAIIARSGEQNYLAHELGIFDGDPNKVVVLDRPAEEVTDPMSVASFINMPITDEHPIGGNVNPSNFTGLSKGIVLDAEPTPSNQIKASLIIYDSVLITKIEDGKEELSGGYTAEIDFSDDGNSATQRKIRGNHVAFVDAARCGKECSIFDSKPITIPKEVNHMAKLTIKGVEYEIADSVAPVVQGLITDNETLSTALTDSEAKVSKQVALTDAATEKVKSMEDEMESDKDKDKKIEDAANERVGVLVAASTFLKDYDPTGKSLVDIKRDVVTDALPDLDLADRDESYINTRFDILVEDGKPSKDGQQTMNDGLRQQITDTSVDVTDAVAVARANKITRTQAAYKAKEA